MPEDIQDFTKKTEVDIAYYVLQHKGATMYYKDLVLDVIEKKHKPVQSLSAAISEVYTLINMGSGTRPRRNATRALRRPRRARPRRARPQRPAAARKNCLKVFRNNI